MFFCYINYTISTKREKQNNVKVGIVAIDTV